MSLECLPFLFVCFFPFSFILSHDPNILHRQRWRIPRAHWGCFSAAGTAMVGEYQEQVSIALLIQRPWVSQFNHFPAGKLRHLVLQRWNFPNLLSLRL